MEIEFKIDKNINETKVVIYSKEMNEEVKSIIKTLTDRLQAYAAKNAFDVLKTLLCNHLFDHSVFYKIKCYLHDEYSGYSWSSHGIKGYANEFLNNYGYSSNDTFVRCVVSLLENESIINNINHDVNNSPETYNVSFDLVR